MHNPTFKRSRTRTQSVPNPPMPATSGRLIGTILALALAMVTAVGGPTAVATQVDDLGTNDPTDVEGIEEAPWRAWQTTSTGDGESFSHKSVTVGPNGEPHIQWGRHGQVHLTWREPLSTEFNTQFIDEPSARAGSIAITDDGRIWITYRAFKLDNGYPEVYAAWADDPEGPWTIER